MKFSDHFAVQPPRRDEWFDPILSIDTKLFLDPFLVYAAETTEFQGSHAHILAFFNGGYMLAAESGGDQNSVHYKRLVDMLRFPEVEELCLGYADRTTRGAGSGGGLANEMAAALCEAVAAGVTEIKHFEEVAILREGIGADRISDATAGLLRPWLAQYTERVCAELGVPCGAVSYLRGKYNLGAGRWEPLHATLPLNPYNGKRVILAPQRYLRALPTVNADDFWDYCYDNANEELRREFNEDISSHAAKADIVKVARNHPELRARYLEHCERVRPTPYDFERDAKGVQFWYEPTKAYCGTHPQRVVIDSPDAFLAAIDAFVSEFANYVENQKGWDLLWNDDGSPRAEDSAQNLFLGLVKHYCKANDIDITREGNIGRGPVDFKVSRGYAHRALLELKLAKNSKFWNGLERQLPKYLEAEEVRHGYFVVIVYTDDDIERLVNIRERVAWLNAQISYIIKPVIVDARQSPPSASKL